MEQRGLKGRSVRKQRGYVECSVCVCAVMDSRSAVYDV